MTEVPITQKPSDLQNIYSPTWKFTVLRLLYPFDRACWTNFITDLIISEILTYTYQNLRY